MRHNNYQHPLVTLSVQATKRVSTLVIALLTVALNFIKGKYFSPLGMLFARVQYGEMIADMRGKINGTVHSRNRAGAYMRNKVTPVNPQTSYQSAVRNRLTGRAQAWRGLTQAQRDAWNAAVSNFKKTNIFGQLRTPSGINLYNRINMNLLNIGASVITDPPLPSAVQALTTLSVAASEGGGTINLTFTPALAADSLMVVEATEPLSAGVSFAKNQFRQIDILNTADLSPAGIETPYIAKFGSVPVEGTKIFVRATIIQDLTGLNGIPLVASAITAA
jgi:hypothetical protein